MLGASLPELGLVALLVTLVLLAQLAPRIGEALGARLQSGSPHDRGPRDRPPRA